MPDTDFSAIPRTSLPVSTIHRARLAVAASSLAKFPEDGDPRAGWDCGRLLEALGLDEESV